jgi:hypothetical protein
MHKEKLNEMYDAAEPAKLIEMLSKADMLDDKSKELDTQATDIKTSIQGTIERRLKLVDQREQDEYFEEQARDLSKQWQLTAASMIKVKRSIMAKGFHSKMDLYVNGTYGFKEYKRFSCWNPFGNLHASFVQKGEENVDKYIYADGKLTIRTYWTRSSGNNEDEKEVLNFAALYKIPQFDQTKIAELCQLTQDYLQFLVSWRNFYTMADYSKADEIKDLLTFGTYQRDDKVDYRKLIRSMPDLVKFRDSITDKLEVQQARVQPIIDKWKEINKNFVVLNELAKKHINI